MNLDILLAFISATTLLAFFPGPDNIYVLTQSLVNGKKYGLATVAGLISGCLVHTTLLAFGVSALIKANDYLFLGIKIFGALYLFYIAYKVFKSDGSLILGGDNAPKKSLFSLFKQGFIMNVLNPKVALFFLAFFPGFLFSNTLNTIVQFYVLGVLFMVVSFVVFSIIAILAGSISSYIIKNEKVGYIFKWLQIVVFVGLGIYILLSDK
ncbi:LysE family translocator [Cellulophaga lytica]|uniref:Lysine exporter protein (LYSE/YGGA) n=1 Tax=Cellulophaga lytica (strain ATCC 23178 / DSM 7489 / JCM 8516 / NBRC 14961 / NCIMB 1423 / VKM B-1433 / Cy l20) TaxID=867900 RepID=F0RFZ7_CELLC|nr:LysE family translocator [Cellulophaga lytica]ADY27957.1 Lysine exporter protein (LYSE/YGGA) [Cellulophaga lytica DSM 7489]AIM59037.1 lysine transporter LysE [Cellulophaga lytica]WQG77853.1 LysE family translocator [Cellulophaga lytica]